MASKIFLMNLYPSQSVYFEGMDVKANLFDITPYVIIAKGNTIEGIEAKE